MTKLKVVRETVFTTDYGEFERCVQEVFGVKEYNFASAEEANNDSVMSYVIDGIDPLDDWDAQHLEMFVKSNGADTQIARTLLQEMVNRGVAEPGKYNIEVSW